MTVSDIVLLAALFLILILAVTPFPARGYGRLGASALNLILGFVGLAAVLGVYGHRATVCGAFILWIGGMYMGRGAFIEDQETVLDHVESVE